MGAVAPSVNHALRNAFMVEVEDFLPEMKIVDECRAARADAQSILVIGNWTTLGGRQNRMSVLRKLMQLAAFTAMKLLVVNGDGGRGIGSGRCGRFFGYWRVCR